MLISNEKSDFERKAIKIPIRAQDAIRITVPLKSKYHIPRLDIIIMPIALYNLSTRIIGAVIFLGILKFSFNNSHFNNSPYKFNQKSNNLIVSSSRNLNMEIINKIKELKS